MLRNPRTRAYLSLNLILVPNAALFAYAAYYFPLDDLPSTDFQHHRWLLSVSIVAVEIIWLNCHGLLNGRTPTSKGFFIACAPFLIVFVGILAKVIADPKLWINPRFAATGLVYASISSGWSSLFRTTNTQVLVAILIFALQIVIDVFFVLLVEYTANIPTR